MIVFHGSNKIIEFPDILHSEINLDFGAGFYVTTNRSQAERWAKRKTMLLGSGVSIVSSYEMSDNTKFEFLDFGEDLERWIDFVCECRNGMDSFRKYDVIMGKVADDKVFRVVDMYKRGIWDKSRAIKEIRVYKTYDQIAFITQRAIDSMLIFKESFEV